MTNDRFIMGSVLMSDVTPTKVEWLWPGRIPKGKITLLEGDPGTGKSTLTLEIAARISRGEALPGDSPAPARGVVLWTAEDDLSDTVAPRLAAAGADMSRIVARTFVKDDQFENRLPTLADTGALVADIERVDAVLVVVDPLVSFLDRGTNIYNDLQVRQVLGPLGDFAADMAVAVLAVRHLHKRASGNPIYAGGGSIAFAGAARSVLLCGKDPDDPTGERRVIARSKGNLAASVPSLAFRMAEAGDVSRIEWLGESKHTATSLLAQNELCPAPRDRAREFLVECLGAGEVPALDVVAEAASIGIAERTLRRAAKELGKEDRRVGFGPGSAVYWTLPEATGGQPLA